MATEMTREALHAGQKCCRAGTDTQSLLSELANAALPFAWVRPYHVEDDEVIHLTVNGAQMKRLMAALDH